MRVSNKVAPAQTGVRPATQLPMRGLIARQLQFEIPGQQVVELSRNQLFESPVEITIRKQAAELSMGEPGQGEAKLTGTICNLTAQQAVTAEGCGLLAESILLVG
jgi:hypothetical protein